VASARFVCRSSKNIADFE